MDCPVCAKRWPVVCGVPTFLEEPLTPDDAARAEWLAENYDRLSYDEMLRTMTETPASKWGGKDEEVHTAVLAQLSEYRANRQAEWGKYFEEALGILEERGIELPQRRVGLDIGSGKWGGTAAMAKVFDVAIAIEPLLHYCLLSKKLCESQGLKNIIYVCAAGERLPLRDGIVDLAFSLDVLEHVQDKRAVIGESARVLGPGGVLIGMCPNRYTVLQPEVHAALWLLGYLPRWLAVPYARWRRGLDYGDISPPGLFSLKMMMGRSFRGGRYEVSGRIPLGGGKYSKARRVAELVAKTPGLSQAYKLVAPNFVFIGVKEPAERR